MSNLGQIVRKARLNSGLSQRSLARRAGTTQAAISRIENGLEEPSFERFQRLLLVMGWRPELELVPLAEHGMTEAEMRRQAEMTPQERIDEAVRRFGRARAEHHGHGD